MLFAEILIKKDFIKHKIRESRDSLLSENISADDKTKITKYLFELLDDYQSHLILINKINNEHIIDAAGTKVSVANAVILRDTIRIKMDVFSSYIELNMNSKTIKYDIVSINEQRDKLMGKYLLLTSAIYCHDWGTDIISEVSEDNS